MNEEQYSIFTETMSHKTVKNDCAALKLGCFLA